MGRSPCCEKVGLKKGPWTPEEDQKLLAYIEEHGHGSWRALPAKAGLQRCGKSCRLRWTNYLRPDIKRGKFSLQEEQTIIQLHALLGNRWSLIAAFLPNRTDNEIKNYWNCRLKKQLAKMGIDPSTHRRKTTHSISLSNNEPKSAAKIIHMAQWESTRLEAEARLVKKSKSENKPLNSLVESEILSNLKAMPHLYLCSFDQPHEEIAAAAPKPPSMPPCLDILKAWEIVAADSVSLDADYYNISSTNDSNLESFANGCIAENFGATNATMYENSDIWAVDPLDMGSQQTCFDDDFWDFVPFDSDGRRPGEELLDQCNLSYCGRVGSLLMH